MYVYLKSKGEAVWTAGHYNPAGKWVPESDHSSDESAAARCHWLNGGAAADEQRRRVVITALKRLRDCFETFYKMAEEGDVITVEADDLHEAIKAVMR